MSLNSGYYISTVVALVDGILKLTDAPWYKCAGAHTDEAADHRGSIDHESMLLPDGGDTSLVAVGTLHNDWVPRDDSLILIDGQHLSILPETSCSGILLLLLFNSLCWLD